MAGIQALYLFRIFQTREEFEALSGEKCPPYDPTRDIKSWRDSLAANSPKPRIVYENVLAYGDDGRTPALDSNGSPYFEPLVLPREIASTVNIPPKDFTGALQEQPGTGREVPCPCRELRLDEVLKVGWGGNVQVVDVTQTVTATPFEELVLAALTRIEAKLGK